MRSNRNNKFKNTNQPENNENNKNCFQQFQLHLPKQYPSQQSAHKRQKQNQKLIKKKKVVSKKQQNQGLIIIKEKQIKKMFQHLCDPNGIITIQSLGRAMIKTKKQFEMEDIKNMLNYFQVIKKKSPELVQTIKTQNQQKNNLKQILQLDEDVGQFNQDSVSGNNNYQSQNQINQYSSNQLNQRQSLTFQDFHLLYSYFNK